MIVIDPQGVVQSFSTAAERLFGYAADEVVGRDVSMFMPASYREHYDGHLVRPNPFRTQGSGLTRRAC